MSMLRQYVHANWVRLIYISTAQDEISESLEAARCVFRIIQSLWKLTDTSMALLPKCLSHFKAMRVLKLPILRFRDCWYWNGVQAFLKFYSCQHSPAAFSPAPKTRPPAQPYMFLSDVMLFIIVRMRNACMTGIIEPYINIRGHFERSQFWFLIDEVTSYVWRHLISNLLKQI